LDVESEYWRLVLSGIGSVEACQRLGIDRKTGHPWRAENGAATDPAERGAFARNGICPLLERQRIATLRRDGLGIRQIAQELGRSPSTICRELRRYTAAHDRSYDGDLAHIRARERAYAGRVVADCWSTSTSARWWRPKLGLE
jgi:DNA-binding CsgD family transcriptional regulator